MTGTQHHYCQFLQFLLQAVLIAVQTPFFQPHSHLPLLYRSNWTFPQVAWFGYNEGFGRKRYEKLICQRLKVYSVNIIPIIAKSDTISKEELAKFKLKIMSELLGAGIQTYQFPTGKFFSSNIFQKRSRRKNFSKILVEKDTDHWMFYKRQGSRASSIYDHL